MNKSGPKASAIPASRKFFRSTLFSTLLTFALLSGIADRATAYTVVTVGTGTPTSVETTLVSFATNYFQTTFVKNPLAANVYQITLWGLSPAYQPPVPQSVVSIDTTTWTTNINALTAISTWTYVYGFADGMSYQQKCEIGVIGSYGNLCSSPTNFMLINATTATWNKATCNDLVATFINQLYSLSVSTPVVIPPGQ